ncbi:aromatic acid exporter family protein [Fredinandcohnia sp. QZ13]|uniref:FUSC family protein n=1 Tax=Fredinandcohnia sp. QZ13 TaxID=3073144 RepID=UPI002852FD2C|nr:aromatic acid exporter family protein [Fredinandcohnia sp. QZ13]MDR4888019.1 aromatic acid exporter family protein [Fredinandcohnia sp. QZ13]
MELQKKQLSNKNLSILTWKLSIGSIISWELAELLGSHHPYLAPLTVILTIQSTMDKTISLSIKRMIGTIIGIFVTVLIAKHLPVEGWVLGVLILLGCYISMYLKLDKKVLHQVSLTILFVFVFEHQSKSYAMDRLRDSFVGVLVAGILQLVWFRIFSRKTSTEQRLK